jgi:hypothetical protein
LTDSFGQYLPNFGFTAESDSLSTDWLAGLTVMRTSIIKFAGNAPPTGSKATTGDRRFPMTPLALSRSPFDELPYRFIPTPSLVRVTIPRSRFCVHPVYFTKSVKFSLTILPHNWL